MLACSGRERKEDLLGRPASKKQYRQEGSQSKISLGSRDRYGRDIPI